MDFVPLPPLLVALILILILIIVTRQAALSLFAATVPRLWPRASK